MYMDLVNQHYCILHYTGKHGCLPNKQNLDFEQTLVSFLSLGSGSKNIFSGKYSKEKQRGDSIRIVSERTYSEKDWKTHWKLENTLEKP